MRKFVRWCHISDTHLGYRQYNLLERLKDFGDAFHHATKLILEEQPDFVIITGDIFEQYRPGAPELRQALRIFNLYQKKEIPVFVTAGNHDSSYASSKRDGGDVLSFLEDLGLINYITDDVVEVKDKNEVIALITGLRYYGKRTPAKLQELVSKIKPKLEEYPNVPHLLMLHTYLEGMGFIHEISIYELAQLGFDYIGVGHYHVPWEDAERKIFCPGSTEHRNSNDWEILERRIYVAESTLPKEKDNIVVKPLNFPPIRPKNLITKNLGEINVKDAKTIISQTIQENDQEGAILHFTFNGKLILDGTPVPNWGTFDQYAPKALLVRIYPRFELPEIRRYSSMNQREAIMDVLKSQFDIPESRLNPFISLIEDVLPLAEESQFDSIRDRYQEYFQDVGEEK